MEGKFGKNYFYGGQEANYVNYERINPKKQFKSVIGFIKQQGLAGRILDIGCAFGFLLKEVSPFFEKLYGCDISKFAIGKARTIIPSANLKVVNLDESLPYPDEFFDCITALEVLEHTQDVSRNLEKIARKLKKKGFLIISMPIMAWPRRLFGFIDKDKTHISILPESQLLQMINETKLKVFRKNFFVPLGFFPIYQVPYIPAEIELILQKA